MLAIWLFTAQTIAWSLSSKAKGRSLPQKGNGENAQVRQSRYREVQVARGNDIVKSKQRASLGPTWLSEKEDPSIGPAKRGKGSPSIAGVVLSQMGACYRGTEVGEAKVTVTVGLATSKFVERAPRIEHINSCIAKVLLMVKANCSDVIQRTRCISSVQYSACTLPTKYA